MTMANPLSCFPALRACLIPINIMLLCPLLKLNGRSKFPIGPRTYKQVHKKLKDIRNVFPGTKSWCVISSEGQVLMDGSDALGSEGKEMGNIVMKLKDVAKGVAEMYAVEKDEVNVVRVRGVHCLFSMYFAEDLVFAFYTELGPNSDILNLDFSKEDEQMRIILDNVSQLISKSSRRDSS